MFFLVGCKWNYRSFTSLIAAFLRLISDARGPRGLGPPVPGTLAQRYHLTVVATLYTVFAWFFCPTESSKHIVVTIHSLYFQLVLECQIPTWDCIFCQANTRDLCSRTSLVCPLSQIRFFPIFYYMRTTGFLQPVDLQKTRRPEWLGCFDGTQ